MQELLQSLLDTRIGSVPLLRLIIGLTVGLAVAIGASVFVGIVRRRLTRIAPTTETRFDDTLLRVLQATRPWVYIPLGIVVANRFFSLPESQRVLLDRTVFLLLVLQAGFWGQALIEVWVERIREKSRDNPSAKTAMGALRFVGRTAIWSFVLLVGLDNLGVDITALVTGLGIGGIAVGLALQNVLGDLFASLSIVLDRPFEVGDFIIVGDFLGTVEHIGVKSTRVRSISGEQIVFGNGDLLGSRIRNYKRMEERRALFRFGVEYGTPADKLRQIPDWVRQIIEQQPLARFDRAHFFQFGDSSLDFEVVYYVTQPDFAVMMDTQQDINYALFEKLGAEGVSFAFPTRTLHVIAEKS